MRMNNRVCLCTVGRVFGSRTLLCVKKGASDEWSRITRRTEKTGNERTSDRDSNRSKVIEGQKVVNKAIGEKSGK